jgi:hypothetical protein
VDQASLKVAQGVKSVSEIKPDIDGKFDILFAFGHLLEDGECLFEPDSSVLERRTRQRLLSCLPEVSNGFLQQLATNGMLRQTLNVLAEPITVQSLYRIDKSSVERRPPCP